MRPNYSERLRQGFQMLNQEYDDESPERLLAPLELDVREYPDAMVSVKRASWEEKRTKSTDCQFCP
jgi:hypothetical protein